MPGVSAPHGCEYFTDGTKLLLPGPLLDGFPSGFQKADEHALGKDMEEGDGIPDALEVGWYFQSLAELVPLVPGSGVFLEDCGREAM